MFYIVRILYLFLSFFFLMIRRPPRSTRTDTLFPYTTLFRSDRLLVDTLTAASNAQRGKAPETRLLFRVVFRLLAAKVLQDRHHPYAQGWDAADLASILRAIESYYRSEERRVGKECVRTCRSGWSPYHKKKKKAHKQTDK